MCKNTNPDLKGWNRNSTFGCDLKTILHSDTRMKTGKGYRGVMYLDSDEFLDEYLCRDPHYTFVETVDSTDGKRNPRLYSGQFITVTCRADGTLRPNFRPQRIDAGTNVDAFAIAVCNELRQALKGLVER